jgi:hypothetical protein
MLNLLQHITRVKNACELKVAFYPAMDESPSGYWLYSEDEPDDGLNGGQFSPCFYTPFELEEWCSKVGPLETEEQIMAFLEGGWKDVDPQATSDLWG